MYFNPKKKRKVNDSKAGGKSRLNLDELGDEDEEVRLSAFGFFVLINPPVQEKSGDDRSDAGSNVAESDYDVDEEYDNDYAENYFDNGEGDDMDDLGGGGGGDEGGAAPPVMTLRAIHSCDPGVEQNANIQAEAVRKSFPQKLKRKGSKHRTR
ncbi:hypothetical protein H0H93_001602 [Arthromyces matolae]|nr:hypothetical protein H0H93_001602 [Arthromyces matolae]